MTADRMRHDDVLLTIGEAAELAGVQPRLMQLMVTLGVVEAEHDGNEMRIWRSSAVRFKDSQAGILPLAS